MATNSFKSMLKKTMAPVIFVATLWIAMSSGTTLYVQWLEREYQRIYLENIVSIRAAESLQINVWRLIAEWPHEAKSSPAFRIRWHQAEAQIANQLDKLVQTSFTAPERQVISSLNLSVMALLERLRQASDIETTADGVAPESVSTDLVPVRLQMLEIAGQIAASTNDLLTLNQESLDRSNRQRQRVSRIVISSRLATMIIGPLLGVLLGWRMSRLLHRSIARIAVTLHDGGSNYDRDIGTIAIEPEGDFHDVQQQAEKVVERMRQVSQDLQNARREVMQSERLAAVGELAAGVAHEIRNPLTSVKLLLQHAIRQASGPRLDESQLALILEEIGRMETIVQGLLDFSRPPRLNRVTHDLRQTLQRALNLIEVRARQQGVDIETNTGDIPLIVDGDTEKLHQVFVNLLINATEAMAQGGHLTIDACLVMRPNSTDLPSGVNEVARKSEKRLVKVVVRDTGTGVPEDVLPRLFEPFATSKERGTGLGLAISRRLVEEHHGTIQACNHPQGGAEFTLLIPALERSFRSNL
jgi:two-component system, NtrC family, sensor histidine kinase HydH